MQFSVQFSLSKEEYSDYDYSGDDADFDTEEEKEELSATELDIVPEFQSKDLGKALNWLKLFQMILVFILLLEVIKIESLTIVIYVDAGGNVTLPCKLKKNSETYFGIIWMRNSPTNEKLIYIASGESVFGQVNHKN